MKSNNASAVQGASPELHFNKEGEFIMTSTAESSGEAFRLIKIINVAPTVIPSMTDLKEVCRECADDAKCIDCRFNQQNQRNCQTSIKLHEERSNNHVHHDNT
jgi:hypothetical protein